VDIPSFHRIMSTPDIPFSPKASFRSASASSMVTSSSKSRSTSSPSSAPSCWSSPSAKSILSAPTLTSLYRWLREAACRRVDVGIVSRVRDVVRPRAEIIYPRSIINAQHRLLAGSPKGKSAVVMSAAVLAWTWNATV
jgi:hypothetical protein